ncbi:MAG: hypothetical protein ACRDP7_49380 [Trebonia sp.]
MQTWTNLAWPDDPYRTGQQLYRKPGGRLAAFTTWPAIIGGQQIPAATAIVYLPLLRNRPVTVTGQTLAFGFRAASASGPAEVPAVAVVADLDLMQARRHAVVLTGYHLDKDLAVLQQADGVTECRGLAAVAGDWAGRGPVPGRAALFDCDLDMPGGLPLGRACQQAGISPVPTSEAGNESCYQATLAVERALAIALLCARHQGRYQWDGTLDTRTVMTASAWDCLPWPQAGAPGADTVLTAAHGQHP